VESKAFLPSLFRSLQSKSEEKIITKTPKSNGRPKELKAVITALSDISFSTSTVVPRIDSLPALSHQYSLVSTEVIQVNPKASVLTNQLLICRISVGTPLQTLLTDFQYIGNLLSVSIDLVEYEARSLAGSGTFLKEGTRYSAMVLLKEFHQFHTMGALRSTTLLIFAQKGLSPKTTTYRLTVQAVP